MEPNLKASVSLSVAIGALRAIAESLPHNGRQSGGCRKLADLLLKESMKLPRLAREDIDILHKAIETSSEALGQLEGNTTHTMLNLACFLMEEVKPTLKHKHFDKLNQLFSFFDGSDVYFDVRQGERTFERLMTEVEIEVCMAEKMPDASGVEPPS